MSAIENSPSEPVVTPLEESRREVPPAVVDEVKAKLGVSEGEPLVPDAQRIEGSDPIRPNEEAVVNDRPVSVGERARAIDQGEIDEAVALAKGAGGVPEEEKKPFANISSWAELGDALGKNGGVVSRDGVMFSQAAIVRLIKSQREKPSRDEKGERILTMITRTGGLRETVARLFAQEDAEEQRLAVEASVAADEARKKELMIEIAGLVDKVAEKKVAPTEGPVEESSVKESPVVVEQSEVAPAVQVETETSEAPVATTPTEAIPAVQVETETSEAPAAVKTAGILSRIGSRIGSLWNKIKGAPASEVAGEVLTETPVDAGSITQEISYDEAVDEPGVVEGHEAVAETPEVAGEEPVVEVENSVPAVESVSADQSINEAVTETPYSQEGFDAAVDFNTALDKLIPGHDRESSLNPENLKNAINKLLERPHAGVEAEAFAKVQNRILFDTLDDEVRTPNKARVAIMELLEKRGYLTYTKEGDGETAKYLYKSSDRRMKKENPIELGK